MGCLTDPYYVYILVESFAGEKCQLRCCRVDTFDSNELYAGDEFFCRVAETLLRTASSIWTYLMEVNSGITSVFILIEADKERHSNQI